MDRKAKERFVGDPGIPWGMRIRELRIHANLTQEQLAELIETTKATISKMERSGKRPSYEWAEKLSRALRVDVLSLMYAPGQPIFSSAGLLPVIALRELASWRSAVAETSEYIPVHDAREHMFAVQIGDLQPGGREIAADEPRGSYAAIDPTLSTALLADCIYALVNNAGVPAIHVFRKDPDRLEAHALTPEAETVHPGNDPVTIIGRVKSITEFL